MNKDRRNFSGSEKVKILRRHFLDNVPVSNLCDECGLHPTVFYRWQKVFFENGASAFEKSNKSTSSSMEEKVKRLEAKLSHKDGVIAQIMEDHVALKKSLGEA